MFYEDEMDIYRQRFKTLEQRFWEKVNKDGLMCERLGTKCWEWTAAKDRGYGKIRLKDKLIIASRLSWEIKKGQIPDGLGVLHKCDNPACVNPDHLFLGTQADNLRDCSKKGRARGGTNPGETNPSHKLTQSTVAEIRDPKNRIYFQWQLALKYNVGQSTISRVLRGESWNPVNQ